MGRRGLSGLETDAVVEAVELLTEAGYDVTRVNDVERDHHGVQFDLRVKTPTRTKPMTGEPGSEPEIRRVGGDAPGDADG